MAEGGRSDYGTGNEKKLDFRPFGKPANMSSLMNWVGAKVPDKWKQVGIGLKIPTGELNCIQNEEGNKTNATQLMMIKVFEKWEKAKASEYSWQNLADVLLSPLVNERNVMEELYTTLKVSDAPSSNYDILIIGKTGMGKSTTGNKLLGSLRIFHTGSGIDLVTKECQLQTNTNGIRVLDTPGFSNDNEVLREFGIFESNLQILRWIIREQKKYNLQFSRVLYFLPHRGPPERADGVLQEEIKAMHVLFGDDIFNVMVLITTSHTRYQRDFDQEDYDLTSKVFMKAFKTIIGKSLRKCPPILYIPNKESEDNILLKISRAEVIDDQCMRPRKNIF